jgi:hypothetical protein
MHKMVGYVLHDVVSLFFSLMKSLTFVQRRVCLLVGFDVDVVVSPL